MVCSSSVTGPKATWKPCVMVTQPPHLIKSHSIRSRPHLRRARFMVTLEILPASEMPRQLKWLPSMVLQCLSLNCKYSRTCLTQTNESSRVSRPLSIMQLSWMVTPIIMVMVWHSLAQTTQATWSPLFLTPIVKQDNTPTAWLAYLKFAINAWSHRPGAAKQPTMWGWRDNNETKEDSHRLPKEERDPGHASFGLNPMVKRRSRSQRITPPPQQVNTRNIIGSDLQRLLETFSTVVWLTCC